MADANATAPATPRGPGETRAARAFTLTSFTNLALSTAQLGTKYLNQFFVVQREVKDAATGAVKATADYGQLGALLVVTPVLGFVVPFLAILFVKTTRFRSA